MSQQPDLGEQALSKAAEVALASQLDEVEEMDVEIRTDPLKLVSGELESVSIEGKGMVMQDDLRAEALEMRVGNIAIDPLRAAFGDIELKYPTDAEAWIVLTEQDLARAFNSDYIRDKLQNLEVEINSQPTTLDVQKVDFRLPGEGKVDLSAEVRSRETGEVRHPAFTALLRMDKSGDRVLLEEVKSADNREQFPELEDALLARASELLDLRNFALEGMSLQLKNLKVETGKVILQANARIEQFPKN